MAPLQAGSVSRNLRIGPCAAAEAVDLIHSLAGTAGIGTDELTEVGRIGGKLDCECGELDAPSTDLGKTLDRT